MSNNGIELDDFVTDLATNYDGAPAEDTPTLEEAVTEETQVEDSETTEVSEDEDDLYLLDIDEDEADDEPEEESEETDDDDSEEEAEPQLHTVTVDGEEIEVSLDELKKGFGLQKSLTQKGQQLAEERKALEAEIEAVKWAKTAPEIREKDKQIQEAMRAIETGIHYDADGNPVQLTKAQIEATQRNVNAAIEERNAMATPPRLDDLKEAIPGMFDPDVNVRNSTLKPFADTLQEYGYSDVEMKVMDDPRIFLMLKELQEGRDLKAKVARAKAKKSEKDNIVQRPTKTKQSARAKSMSKSKQDDQKILKSIQDGDSSPAALFDDIF